MEAKKNSKREKGGKDQKKKTAFDNNNKKNPDIKDPNKPDKKPTSLKVGAWLFAA